MKKIIRIIAVVMLMASFTACEELAQIANQAAQVMNLKNCTFDVTGINNIQMLGIDINKGMTSSSLTAMQVINVTNSLMNKKLPVTSASGPTPRDRFPSRSAPTCSSCSAERPPTPSSTWPSSWPVPRATPSTSASR